MADLQQVLRDRAGGLVGLAAQGDGARRGLAAARRRRPHAAGQLGADPGVRRRVPTSTRAIGRVEAWYARRGLPACFQLTDRAAPARLDAVLEGRGYARLPPVSVLLLDIAGLEPRQGTRASSCDTRPTPQVMNAVCDPHWGPATRRARAELFARIRRAARVRRPARGRPAGRGRPVRGRRRARRHLHAAHRGAARAAGATAARSCAGSRPGARHGCAAGLPAGRGRQRAGAGPGPPAGGASAPTATGTARRALRPPEPAPACRSAPARRAWSGTSR